MIKKKTIKKGIDARGRERERERGREGGKSCFENESALSASGNANEPLIVARVRQSYTRTDSFREASAEMLRRTAL